MLTIISLSMSLGSVFAGQIIPWEDIAGGVNDPVCQTILQTLGSCDSHSNPSRAFEVLLRRLQGKIPMDAGGCFEPPLNSCSDVAKYFNCEGGPAQKSWFKPGDCIEVVSGVPYGKGGCGGRLTRWYRDRCYFNLLVEEATHWWQHGVSNDCALRLTPKYAYFLDRTGLPFCPETYFSALMDEYGRPLSSIELRPRYSQRGLYIDYLKSKGICGKIKPGGMPLIETAGQPPGLFSRICRHPIWKWAGCAAWATGVALDTSDRMSKNQNKECLTGVVGDSFCEALINSGVEWGTAGCGRFDLAPESQKNNCYDPEKGTWTRNFRGDWAPASWQEFGDGMIPDDGSWEQFPSGF